MRDSVLSKYLEKMGEGNVLSKLAGGPRDNKKSNSKAMTTKKIKGLEAGVPDEDNEIDEDDLVVNRVFNRK